VYKVKIRKSAAKALLKINSKTVDKFYAAFEQLANELNQTDLDIKKLEGREGYRLRIGAYRALYRVLNDELIIDVFKIGSRGDVYK